MSSILFDEAMKIIEAAHASLAEAKAAPPAEAPKVDYHHVLTDEQAQSFQLMMNILNHNGDTVGRGGTVDLLGPPGREYGPTVNKYKPTQAESDAQSHDKRMN